LIAWVVTITSNTAKKQILDNIDEIKVIDLAKELIKIPSFTGEETPVAEFLAKYLEQHGFQIEMQEVESRRFQPLATLKGQGDGASLLFNGHMDIDPLPRDQEDPYKPFVKDNLLYGAGLCNMKAGVAAMVAASVAVATAGVELKGDLICNPVVGELQGGIGTLYTIKHGPSPDAVVIPEPTHQTLLLKHGGVLDLAITTLGLTGHISMREGSIDAMQKMWKVQQALYEMDANKNWTFEFDSDLPDLPLLNMGSIAGGRGRNYELRGPYDVSDVCTLFIDTRINASQSLKTAKKDFEGLLEKLKAEDPELEYELQFPAVSYEDMMESTTPFKEYIREIIGLYMPPFNMPEDEYLVQLVSKCHEQVTKRPPIMITNEATSMRVGGHRAVYAGTDAAHYWDHGVPAFCYGPGCMRRLDLKMGHHPPVPVEQIVSCTKVLALTAVDICTKTNEEYNRLRPK